MTTVVRRRPKPQPTGPPLPVRMQDAIAACNDVRAFGVDADEAKRVLAQYLCHDAKAERPYCTCTSIGGWSFDPQIGVYLHAVPRCWKPSKAYFEAATRAGIFGPIAAEQAHE